MRDHEKFEIKLNLKNYCRYLASCPPLTQRCWACPYMCTIYHLVLTTGLLYEPSTLQARPRPFHMRHAYILDRTTAPPVVQLPKCTSIALDFPTAQEPWHDAGRRAGTKFGSGNHIQARFETVVLSLSCIPTLSVQQESHFVLTSPTIDQWRHGLCDRILLFSMTALTKSVAMPELGQVVRRLVAALPCTPPSLESSYQVTPASPSACRDQTKSNQNGPTPSHSYISNSTPPTPTLQSPRAACAANLE